ncbi:hypothetical protein F4860DRAFT_525945 [Xylaria cubensis]|nr:hypothetical protein F4860DRAFT_525945 [Xylaria cubensis]
MSLEAVLLFIFTTGNLPANNTLSPNDGYKPPPRRSGVLAQPCKKQAVIVDDAVTIYLCATKKSLGLTTESSKTAHGFTADDRGKPVSWKLIDPPFDVSLLFYGSALQNVMIFSRDDRKAVLCPFLAAIVYNSVWDGNYFIQYIFYVAIMKIYGLAVFSTLALSACLSRSVNDAEAVTAVGQGDAADVDTAVQAGVIGNNSAVANGSNGDNQNENQDNQNEGEENNVEDGSNVDGILNGNLEDSFNDINIDPNDIQGSLGQNILDLLLAMGICNFNLNSLQGLSLGNEIQLLLQLQQLQQLQALGIVNSFAVDQLIQREILSQTFNLGEAQSLINGYSPDIEIVDADLKTRKDIIRRSIDASVKQASRGRKRTTILRRQCANIGQGNTDNGASQVDQGQADQQQVNQDQANQDQENQDQGKNEAEEEVNEANEGESDAKDENKDSEEGVEVE